MHGQRDRLSRPPILLVSNPVPSGVPANQWDRWDQGGAIPSIPSIPNSIPLGLAYCSTYRILNARMGSQPKTLDPIDLIGEEYCCFEPADGQMGFLGSMGSVEHKLAESAWGNPCVAPVSRSLFVNLRLPASVMLRWSEARSTPNSDFGSTAGHSTCLPCRAPLAIGAQQRIRGMSCGGCCVSLGSLRRRSGLSCRHAQHPNRTA